MSSSSPTNEYIYALKPIRTTLLSEGPTPEEEQIISEHWDYLVDLHQKGIVLLCGRTMVRDASAFGIVILKSDSREKAEEIMRGDPVVRKGVMRSEIFPFQIFLKETPSPLQSA